MALVRQYYLLKLPPFSQGKEFLRLSRNLLLSGCPFYVSYKLFIEEMCKPYKTWAHFFNERRKNQFIPLPWKIGEFIVKHITHLDELVGHLDKLGLKEGEFVKSFDPDNMFTTHMDLISYSSYFTKI
jgi:hypothetical protein